MLKQAIYALQQRLDTVKSHVRVYNNIENIQTKRDLKHLYENNVQELESIEEALEILQQRQVINELLYT